MQFNKINRKPQKPGAGPGNARLCAFGKFLGRISLTPIFGFTEYFVNNHQ
jgi:hypothetical protein